MSRDRRLLPDLSGGDFHVLLRERTDHVGRSQPATRHALRIEPQPHGVLALAEDEHVRDARNALQRVPHVHVEIVAHEQRGVAIVVGDNGGTKDKILRSLCRRDADGFDRRGQTSLRRVDAVLNVDGGQIGIAIQIEGGDDAAGSVIAARGSDVLHSLGAVDLLLERNGDRAFHGLGACSDIDAGDAHLRRRQIWELCDGQRGNNCRACQNDQQRADGCEYRTSNEEVNEHEKFRCGFPASAIRLPGPAAKNVKRCS